MRQVSRLFSAWQTSLAFSPKLISKRSFQSCQNLQCPRLLPSLSAPTLGVRFLRAPLDGAAARPESSAPRWWGSLSKHCGHHALQIIRDSSAAIVLLFLLFVCLFFQNGIRIALVRTGLQNHPFFWKGTPWPEIWSGSFLGAKRSCPAVP